MYPEAPVLLQRGDCLYLKGEMQMKTTEIVQIIAAVTMVILVIGVFIERLSSKKAIGARAIQFLTVGLLIPTIVILSLEKAIGMDATATIIGSMIGYLLSGIGDYRPGELNDKKPVTRQLDQEKQQN
jgi:hypothetical protein